jgi:hypothetical protein
VIAMDQINIHPNNDEILLRYIDIKDHKYIDKVDNYFYRMEMIPKLLSISEYYNENFGIVLRIVLTVYDKNQQNNFENTLIFWNDPETNAEWSRICVGQV